MWLLYSITTIICMSCVFCAVSNQRQNISEIRNNFNKALVEDNLTKISSNNNNYSNTKETKDESNTNSLEESRGKKEHNKKDKKDLMSRILPLMVIPFLISTSLIPMMLVSLKAMLLKSMIIGKIAVVLLLFNLFRRRVDGGGVYSHNINEKDLSMAHYGYNGDEEYGAYVNKRSFQIN